MMPVDLDALKDAKKNVFFYEFEDLINNIYINDINRFIC